MKFKLNIISIIILYHIIFESLVTYYNFDEIDRKILTPFGRIFRKLILNQNINKIYSIGDFAVFAFNLFIIIILLYITDKYYGTESVLKTFAKLFIFFIVINLIIIGCVILTGLDQDIIFLYLFYILFPMFFLLLLILPLFWVNKNILNVS